MTDLYLTALREHQAGNLDLAEKIYREIIAAEPKNHDVLHLLSILLAQRKDFLNAHYFIERALAITPNSPTFHNSMGNILKNLNQHEGAISHYKTALQLQPDNASVHNNLGNVFYHMEKIDEAKEHYYEAIRLRPQYVDAYYNLSLVLIKQDSVSEASKNLRMILQIQPGHDKAHGSLAYLLQMQGEFDQAMHHYQKALEGNDDNVLSHHNLGVILTNKGRYYDAIPHFKKTLDLQPEHVEALSNLGSIFMLQRKAAEALPYFFLLARLTHDFDAYYNLGVIYIELSSFDEAVIYFEKALKILPNDFATNINLGVIHLQRRDFDKAESYYLQAHNLQPNNEEVSYILAAIGQKSEQSKAPAGYVKNLFDQYAPYFDKHLEMLGHEVPQLLFDAVQNVVGRKESDLMVLDLGCGTGMSGAKFKSSARRLIGIDLSEKMLEIAQSKNIYTDLRLGAIEDVVIGFSDLDVIIASDTLVYFGDLMDIFSKCHLALKDGGVFAFTVEESGKSYPYELQRSARFAHSGKYINEIATQNNFVILQSDKIVLRKHGDDLIEGRLFLLRKGHQ